MSRSYDTAGQLIKQADTDAKGKLLQEQTYSYNVFGEVIEKQVTDPMDTSRLEVVQMEYNAANRLTKYNGQEVQYDAKGNMVYGPVDGTMQHLTYDCRNRLVEAGGISYEYDAENTRTASICGKKRTEYVTDTSGSLSRLLLAYEADGATTSYAYGAEGLTAQYNSGTEQNLLYHYDNIGSTTLLTNLTGTIIERFAYGTYGELLQKAKNAVRFLYNGSYGVVTDENGLYYMRARYYNPDIKRFLNQDIKVGDISNGQGLNRYAYCEGNPVSMVDPFGLSPQISQDQTSRFSVLHNILDLAGLAFDAADVINAAFYAAEGDWTNAALCAVAVIPIAGSAIAGAAKGTKAVVKAKKAEKILELAEESCKMTRNASDRLDVFSDVMKASSKWGNSPVKLMDGITAETGSRAIKALETGGDFGRESKRAVQELKAVAGAEGIHLKPSVSRKVDVFKDSFVKTEKKVKSGSKTNFDNEIPRSGSEWNEYLKGMYGADNVHWNINSVDDIFSDPTRLKGYTVDELQKVLGNDWTRGVYGSNGGGWKLMNGDISIFYHPGGGKHGGSYYGISSGATGKIKVVNPETYIPLKGDKATIIYD